jgi:hypothetical protein
MSEDRQPFWQRIPGATYAAGRLGARGQRIVKRSAQLFAILFVLIGLLGYFWLPGFAKTKLEGALTEALKRPVTIQRIAVSPYTLSATVEGLKAGDTLSVSSLYVNVSSSSLFRLLPVIQEVRIADPRLHLVRESENRLDISDLLDEWAAKPSSGPTPEFVVGNITMTGGQVEWVDKVIGKTQTVSEIRLGVPFIANVPSKVEVFVEPMFSAKLDGAPLNLTGKARPFSVDHDASVDITLDGFDLTRLTAYVKLPFTVQSALLDTRLQVLFRHKDQNADSLSIAGDIALRNVQGEFAADKLSIDVPLLALKGLRADVFGQKYTAETLALQTRDGKQAAADLNGKPLTRIGEFKFTKLALNLPAHQADIGEIQLNHSEVMLARTRQGNLNVMELFAAAPEKNAKPAPAAKADKAAPKAEAKNEPVWHWSVGKTAINDSQLHFADEAVTDQTLKLSDLTLALGKLDSADKTAVPLALKSAVNEHGTLSADGTITLDGKTDLKLDLSKVDLAALQGWVTANLNAVLTRGDLSFAGEVHAAGGNADVTGDAVLADFNVLDRVNSDDMLRWKQLKLDKIAVHTQPFGMSIGEIGLRDFFAQLLVNPKGQLNLKGIVKESTPQAAAPGAPTASPAPAATPPVVASAPVAPAKTEPPLPVKIGKITLANGNIDFSDEFIKPNYSARLTGLNGRIGALAAGTQSPVDITGKIDRAAPVHISGKVDPFASQVALNIQASAKGIDLPNLSSYSGRYLGYAIAKGKLSADVSYRIEKGELIAENRIVLDQLTLGDKVESPSALDIPIGLAISLLQDSRGVIDLDLPIRGSLNDPQFSIGAIVVKVIVNFVVKAVTSPFALLGSLFGGGEDLSNLMFVPGQSALTPDNEKRLQAIAKAMADRPGLKVEITGYADPAADREGLKRALLDRKIKARKLADQTRFGKRGSMEDVTVSAEEYPKYLEEVYSAEKIPNKPRNAIGIAKSVPVADMEKLLLDYLPVTENDLNALADERGHAAQTWLTGQGAAAPDRVFLMNSKVAPAEKEVANNRVGFSLR